MKITAARTYSIPSILHPSDSKKNKIKKHHSISLHLNLAKEANAFLLAPLCVFKAISDIARERCLDFLIFRD